jgi:hypothetical protein
MVRFATFCDTFGGTFAGLFTSLQADRTGATGFIVRPWSDIPRNPAAAVLAIIYSFVQPAREGRRFGSVCSWREMICDKASSRLCNPIRLIRPRNNSSAIER